MTRGCVLNASKRYLLLYRCVRVKAQNKATNIIRSVGKCSIWKNLKIRLKQTKMNNTYTGNCKYKHHGYKYCCK